MLRELGERLQGGVLLAGLVTELGYACSSSKEAFKHVLRLAPQLDEAALAQLVGAVARTHSGLDSSPANFARRGPTPAQPSSYFFLLHALQCSTFRASAHCCPAAKPCFGTHPMFHRSICGALGLPQPDVAPLGTWNTDEIVDAVLETRPGLSWPGAMGFLDHDGFLVTDQTAFLLLISMYRRATSEPFPIGAVAGGLWANTAGQLSFLRLAAAAPSEVFSWAHAARRQPPLEGVPGGRSPLGTPNSAWLCLDLIQSLALLAEADHLAEMRAVLDQPLKQCPELLLLGCAQTRTEWNVLQNEACNAAHPAPPPFRPRSPARCAVFHARTLRFVAAEHAAAHLSPHPDGRYFLRCCQR